MNILVGVDGNAVNKKAIAFAINLARKLAESPRGLTLGSLTGKVIANREIPVAIAH